jgi:hypothetical protein
MKNKTELPKGLEKALQKLLNGAEEQEIEDAIKLKIGERND